LKLAIVLTVLSAATALAAPDTTWPPPEFSHAQLNSIAAAFPEANSVVVDQWRDLDLRYDHRAGGFVGAIQEYEEIWIRSARSLEDHARVFKQESDRVEVAEQRIEILAEDGDRQRVSANDLTWLKRGSRDGDIYLLDSEDAYAVIPGLHPGDRLRVWTRYKVKCLTFLPVLRFGGAPIPYARQCARLRLPADHELQAVTIQAPKLAGRLRYEMTVDGPDRIHTWRSDGFDPAEFEPFAPLAPANDVTLILHVSAMATTIAPTNFSVNADWRAGAAAYYLAIAATMEPDAAVAAQAARIVAGLESAAQKAAALNQHIQRTCRYLGLYDAHGGLIPENAAVVSQRGFGDCKGLGVYLIALLRAAGIPAYPALVRTRNAGPVVTTCPSLGQFNHFIVWADTGGEGVWLDATAKSCRAGVVPAGDAASPVLLVQPGREGLVAIPRAAWDPGVVVYEVTGLIDAACGAEFQVTIDIDGVVAGDFVERQARADPAQQQQIWTRLLTPTSVACVVTPAKLIARANTPADTVWTISLALAQTLPVSADRVFLPRTLPPLSNLGPIKADRLTDMDLRAVPRRHEDWRVTLPAGWRLAQPDTFAVLDQAVVWTCKIWQEGGDLRLQRDVSWSETVLPAANAGRFVEILQKITAVELGFTVICKGASP
jgi:transglutaminase-like putative cysteine protease